MSSRLSSMRLPVRAERLRRELERRFDRDVIDAGVEDFFEVVGCIARPPGKARLQRRQAAIAGNMPPMEFSACSTRRQKPASRGLFVASFLAATLLPGGSEALLFALLKLHPEQALPALIAGHARQHAGRHDHLLAWRACCPAREAAAASCTGCARHGSARPVAGLGADRSATRCAPPPAGCACPGLPARSWMAAGKFARYAVIVVLGGI